MSKGLSIEIIFMFLGEDENETTENFVWITLLFLLMERGLNIQIDFHCFVKSTVYLVMLVMELGEAPF